MRILSSSGGAFTEISWHVLRDSGVVFGCALNDKLQAQHIYVETLDGLTEKLSGSKYVQSHIGETYKLAKAFLQQGRKVLFSGTPCQIAGLKNVLRKEYDNLLTVDLICHGVPSPKVFEDYKKYIQQRENMELTSVKFRCKKSSWIFYNMTCTGHIEKTASLKRYEGCYYEDPYIRGFLRDYFLRPSCHQCHFTSTKRYSDFTIADWWGYQKSSAIDKDFAYKGVSLLLVNTDKALKLLPHLKMYLRERTMEDAKRTNISLSRPFPFTTKRDSFWKDYKTIPFDKMIEKYMMPEKVAWDVNLRQHHRNTDYLLKIIRFLMLPQRIYNKISKLLARHEK